MHPAQSAGLGRFSVLSALGQPLRAEVDVTSASREEAASMTARLAPAEAFRLAGVDYNPVLSTLRFSVATRPDGRSIVRITSLQPVDEPVVDLLVELNWAGGRLVRKYTFLLDPPEIKLEQRAIVRGNEAADTAAPVVEGDIRPAAPPRAAAPAATASRTSSPRPPTVRAAPTAGAPAVATPSGQPAATQLPAVPPSASNRAASAAASPATSPAGGSATALSSSAPSPTNVAPATPATPASAGPATVPGTVVVREGETIATVANRTRPPAIHIDQAIIALYRANPAAFFGSVHLLKAGATLTVPDEQTMASVDRIAARNEIRGIRSSRETARPADAPSAATPNAPAAVTAEPARVGTPSSDTPPSKTPPASSPAAPSSAELLRAARTRIVELERTVDALRKEVDEADLRIAELQKQLPGIASSPAVPTASSVPSPRSAPAATSPPSPTSAPAAASSSPSPASAPAASSSSSPSPASAPAASSPSPMAAPAGAAASSPSQAPTSAATLAVPSSAPSTPAPSVPAASVPSPSVAGTPASAPAAPQSTPADGITTLVDDLLAEPAVPVGGTALLAALLAGLAYRARRRRKAAGASGKPADAGEEPPNSLFGTTAHDEFDPNVTTSTHDSDAAFHSTEIDPISEAEVYVAYGRQSQAEEILRNALREHPERQPVRLRLMELLAIRNDRAGFATLAGEMFDKTGGRNEEWPKAVTLGLMVDPDNPIYTGWTKTGDTSASTGKASNDKASSGSDSTAAEGSAAPHGAAADAADLEWTTENLRNATLEQTAAPAPTAAPEDALDFVPTPIPNPTSASTTASLAAEASEDASNEPTDPAELDIPLAFELPAPIEISAPVDSQSDADEPVPPVSMQGEESELLTPPTLIVDAPETNIISPMSERKRREQFDTALELALAYHELGDKEGVREMLRDVLESGTDAQKLKARQILAKAEGTSAQPSDH